MKLQRKDIDIMAPVGSYESLAAAIQAGTTSIYFGIENLNMRAKSSNNFGLDDLKKITTICSENGVKSYLTINTIMYDEDLQLMHRIVDAASVSNVSAIIAADIATIEYSRKMGVEVHISTQLSVSNSEALKYYSQYADVVVLARELKLEQIQKIFENIANQDIRGPHGLPVKIELFAHGAFCMSISGRCFMSLHETNQSANRGACRQTCRKSYLVTEKESGNQMEVDSQYIMSPKDLCTIGIVDLMIKSGVSVFKIEGRARSAEYVKTVVECYREAIDSYFDNSYTPDKISAWVERLKMVFNRGFWDGYYMGHKTFELSKIYGSKATKKKFYVGKVTNYFSNLGVGEFLLEADKLEVGQEVMIVGPTTGVIQLIVSEIRLEFDAVPIAEKGNLISIPVSQKLRRADKLYKLVDETPLIN